MAFSTGEIMSFFYYCYYFYLRAAVFHISISLLFFFQIRDRFVKEPAFEDITLESERKRSVGRGNIGSDTKILENMTCKRQQNAV